VTTVTHSLDLVLDCVTLSDGSTASIGVNNGRIACILHNQQAPRAAQRIDLKGALVTPSLVDGHLHLDTTLFGDRWRPHRQCTDGFDVRERLLIQKDLMAEAAPIEQRAARLIEQAVLKGTGQIRTHVEIDVDFGIANFEAMLAMRERYRGIVDIQIVGLARGLLERPGTLDLLHEALRNGADVVGGLDPAGFEGDVVRHLDTVFALADRYGVGIDLHLHDSGSLGLYEILAVAERTAALSLQDRVAVSHAYALGELPWTRVAPVAERLARAGVAIMTNAPGDHPFPPVMRLRAAGVTVFAGNDDVRDSWWPYGDADMLERIMLIGYRSGLYTDPELEALFDMATTDAARALGVGDYGLDIGARADLLAMPVTCVPEAVVERPDHRMVFKAGLLVAREGRFLTAASGAPDVTARATEDR
jgi:cytosine deaminase